MKYTQFYSQIIGDLYKGMSKYFRDIYCLGNLPGGLSDKDSMGLLRPKKDWLENDEWFNRNGFQQWYSNTELWRQYTIEKKQYFRAAFLITIVTLTVAIMVIIVRDIYRDRKGLEHVQEVVFKRCLPSVVIVKMYGGEDMHLLGIGNGVVVGHGTVITNRHVVEKGDEIRIIDHGQEYQVYVSFADKEYDLATLEVPGLPAPPVKMAFFSTIRPGQRVYAIGSPKGFEMSINDGLVSSVRSFGDFSVIQTSPSISKGSNGSGLFDAECRLVGIMIASAVDGQNMNFALSSDVISQLPARTADIKTLKPIVSLQQADDINNRAIHNELQEGNQPIDVSENELMELGEVIDRYTFTMKELKRSMDGVLSYQNPKAYSEMVPLYNQLASQRDEFVNRYTQKRREFVALVVLHNKIMEHHSDQGHLQ